MADKKRASKRQTRQETGPIASRPYIPGYGVPKHKKGLLPWSHVSERMDETLRYWVSTVSPDGRPHATPVDGLWVDECLYFGGSTKTRRSRNLAKNRAVCIHLEDALDVVILHGDAEELINPDSSLVARLIEASEKKYNYAPEPKDFKKGGIYVFRPRMVLAWTDFPKDATRWHFKNGD